MIRPHIHLHVRDLDESIAFYTALFNQPPSRRAHDYAQWRLDTPALNLALSPSEGAVGIDHVGLDAEDLADTQAAAKRVGDHAVNRETCCYARSDKAWIQDPNNVTWELFHTTERLATTTAETG